MSVLIEDNFAALQEILGYLTPVEISWRAAYLTQSQVVRIQADIALWESVKNDTVKIKATSRAAVELDPDDQKNQIRSRVEAHLGLKTTDGDSAAVTVRINRG